MLVPGPVFKTGGAQFRCARRVRFPCASANRIARPKLRARSTQLFPTGADNLSMGDFDYDSLTHPPQHEIVADETKVQPHADANVDAGWSPSGPAAAPANGQLPGLMTSAGAEPHSELVWRDVPPQPTSLIDFDVKSLEAEQLLAQFPSQQGHGPL